MRRLDDNTYVVYYDGDLFRKRLPSDVGEDPCATVQDLNSSDRKYATSLGNCRTTART